MRTATFSAVALLLLVSAALWSFSQGEATRSGHLTSVCGTEVTYRPSPASEDGKSLQDCCLSTGSKEIPARIVVDYTIQLPENGCKIHAVMFLTKHNKQLCAPPQPKWVKRLIVKINKGKRPKSLRRKKQRKSQNKKKRQA